MINWIKVSDQKPKEDVLLLVTNRVYVEIVYIENGKCIKPWRFDKNDVPAFKDITKFEYWCEIDMIN